MLLSLKSLLFRVQQKRKDLQYRNTLSQRNFHLPSDGIHPNYGNVITEDSAEIIHGGKIKLLHLQEVFPENNNSFNILYLVSSARSPFAEELVRWTKGKGVKLIWNQDGVAYPAWAGKNTKFQNEEMSRLIHQADYVIYQSAFCRESADRFLGPVKVPAKILMNCADIHLFYPRDHYLPPTPWTLLAAGTHQQPDRVFSILEAVSVLKRRQKDIRLILAGRLDWPRAEEEVRNTIDRYDIADLIVSSPPYSQEEAPQLYQRAHVLLHTKYKDPCPTVVIEAMACGLPVIGSKSGGMPELVGEEGGLLIDVPDSWNEMYYPSAEKLADAVENIFDDLPGWRIKARKRALELFNKETWIKSHKKIFETILTFHE